MREEIRVCETQSILMMAQGRNIDQILSYLLLQLKVERGWRLRKMFKKLLCCLLYVLHDTFSDELYVGWSERLVRDD